MKTKKPWKLAKKITGTSAGYKVIDKLFNGLQPGEVTLIGGRPLMGKNSLAYNISVNVSQMTGKRVVFFEGSRGKAYAEKWYLSYLSGIPFWDLSRWDFSGDQWENFIHATEEYRELKFEALGTFRLESIIEQSEEFYKEDEIALIVVDYLQIIEKNDKKTIDNPNEVMIELNALAKRLNVPIIVLTSLREKEITRRKDKRPCAKDLKNAGISEEYWENALLLHRPDMDKYESIEKIEIVATKAYTDVEFDTYLYFDSQNLHYIDIDSYELLELDDELYSDYEDEIEEENLKYEEEILSKMQKCLEKNGEYEAMHYANKLRKIDYFSYSEEIEECFRTCAKRGNVKALLYMEDKYKREGKVCEEEFDILKQLIDLGYTLAFGRIADCYLNGIGCEKDRQKALLYYISGSIFWEDEYCENMIEENFKKESEWDNLSQKITDLYMYDWTESERARMRLANDIFEGRIKEFKTEVAYYIFKYNYIYDVLYHETEAQYCSIPCLSLAKCLLYGIGTSAKPNVALAVLNDAKYLSEWERNSGDLSAFDRIEEIESMIKEIEDNYGKISPEYSDDEFDFYNEEDAFLGDEPYFEEEEDYEDETY